MFATNNSINLLYRARTIKSWQLCVQRRNISVDQTIKELLKGCQTIVEREVEWGSMDSFKHVNNVQFNRWFEVVRVKHMTDMSLSCNERAYLSSRGVGPILKDVYALFKVFSFFLFFQMATYQHKL